MLTLAGGLLVSGAAGPVVWAQSVPLQREPGEPAERAAAGERGMGVDAADAGAADGGERDTRQIIDELIAQRGALPGVAPAANPEVENLPSRVGVPAARVDLDPAVVGVLPGDPLPRLRREGEFIVQRAGQLVEVPEIDAWIFVFDATPGQEDLRPMVVQPCQRLASMQDTLGQRRDDRLPMQFTLTGQVHTYRGVNYLLPTAIAGTRVLPPPSPGDAADDGDPAAGASNSADADISNTSGAADGLGDRFGLDPDSPQTPATFDGGPGAADGGGAVDLMGQMLGERDEAPPRPDTAPLITGPDPGLDPALRGVMPRRSLDPGASSSPPAESAELRREGEYLVSRSGRLTRGVLTGVRGSGGGAGGGGAGGGGAGGGGGGVVHV